VIERDVEAPRQRGDLQRRSFDAMGATVELLLEACSSDEDEAALAAAEAEFHRLDQLFSRFRPDSELSVLNRAGELVAGPELLELTELALDARERTGGRFDPTVHDALLAAGYDRTFDDLPADSEGTAAPVRCGGRVRVDSQRRSIQLEPGARLDFGGIAKGYAADRVCDFLCAKGPCLVNAGGDLAVRGRLGGGPWPVGVETPQGAVTLALDGGAMATTGRDRRCWRRNGQECHHLIDPATGRPAAVDLLRVTVVAGTAVEAEVLAKSFFLAGERGAVRAADKLRVPCVLVAEDERVVLAGGLCR
jgi:FAD:protein FMN transferase